MKRFEIIAEDNFDSKENTYADQFTRKGICICNYSNCYWFNGFIH